MNEKRKGLSLQDTFGSTEGLVEVATRKRVWERKKKKLIFLFIPILALISITFLALFAVYLVQYKNLLKKELCTTEDCIDTANTLQKIMDKTKDPCKDFYAYACGQFGQLHPLTDGSVYRSWFEEGEDQLSQMTQAVLEKINNKHASNMHLKIKKFYDSCIDSDKLEELGMEPLFRLLSLVGLPKFPSIESAETFNLGKTMGLLQRHLNMDILVEVSFDRNEIRPGEPNDTFIIQISPLSQQSRPSLKKQYKSKQRQSDIRRDPSTFSQASAMSPEQVLEERLKFMAQVMKIMQYNADETGEPEKNNTELLNDAFKILAFTVTLNEALQYDERPFNTTDKDKDDIRTFATLQSAMDDASPGVTGLNNRISWQDFVDGLFSGEKGYWTYDYSEDLVQVHTLKAFKILADFLGNHQAASIERYVWWTVVSEYARFTTDEMESVYRKLHETIVGKNGGTSRERTCVGYVRKYFPLAIAKEIKNTFGLSNETTKVTEMLSDIVNEFENLVEEIKWMDRHTKQLNVEKAKAVGSIIGYEATVLDDNELNQYYKDLVIEEDQFLMNMASNRAWELQKALKLLKQSNDSVTGPLGEATNPIQVNAYYARTYNAIYVPAGILQRPFYKRGLECLNYGAIGSILGHELTHGFDSDGKNYDRHGKVRKQIWSPEITEHFSKRALCFVQQYSAFNLTKHQRLDGEFTLAENIADNGGIRESYYAYQSYIKRHGPEPKLPGFEDFSHEQLLFLAFATIWCETSTERYRELASQDNHSPNRVRVLAALQNMKEFAQAFHCPAESFMNPRNKCIIW